MLIIIKLKRKMRGLSHNVQNLIKVRVYPPPYKEKY